MYVNSMAPFGGIERVIANLANNLANDYDVTILVKDVGKCAYFLDSRVKVESISTELKMNMESRLQRIFSVPLNIISTLRPLKEFLKRNKFDVIYTAFPTNGLEAYLADKSVRSKIVASEHASYYAYNKVYRKMKEFLYPKLSVISVPTTMDTEIYQKLGYKATYIPHLTTYSAQANGIKLVNTKTIINVGRLTADKQQLQLLKIWEKVNSKLPNHDWNLQIIGSGEEEETLKTYAVDKHLTNVSFINHTKSIEDYYSQSELFLFTSKMEGFGMVLLEAMSFGVPCISYDCASGPRDMIKDGINGYLIPPGQEDLFADKICHYILSSDEEKAIFRKRALETILNWDNQKIMQSWESLFNELEKKK